MNMFPGEEASQCDSRSSVAILGCSAMQLRFAMSDAPRGGHTKNPASAGGRTRGLGLVFEEDRTKIQLLLGLFVPFPSQN